MDKHTYVIGDIHGEAEQLKMLLQKMDLKAEDEMYVLGDVVDRGKYPMEALQILMSLQIVLVWREIMKLWRFPV